jgi:hypothetical protein
MTTWQQTINQIQSIIDSTVWNAIESPAQAVPFIEAKAKLIEAVRKIEKAMNKGER